MESRTQKLENGLNLALSATEEEREKSYNLNVGYNGEERTWTVVVKYTGDLAHLFAKKYRVVELLNEYAIITLPAEEIELLASMTEIEYVEKPKRLFFERTMEKLVSCISAVQRPPLSLTGEGVLIGILDSGIDYENREFRYEDGTTRILSIWDQTIEGDPPAGYSMGTEYNREDINDSLAFPRYSEITLTRDNSGHGTAVAGIAVGQTGVATKSEIIIVKLGVPEQDGFPRTTELMQGLDYVVKKAMEHKKPIAINISFGNTYGSHNGSGLLERFIDDISNYWKSSICVGAGNEGNAAGHTEGVLEEGVTKRIELMVDRRELSFDVQLWKPYEDEMEITLVGPNGQKIGVVQRILGMQRFRYEETEILLYYGEPSPHSVLQEIYMEFIPQGTYVNSGMWILELRAIKVVTGNYAFWLPSYYVLNEGTRFSEPKKERSLTIPGTALKVITVGAYDSRTFTYADFSGRGAKTSLEGIKPDLVAPGVDVLTTSVGGGVKSVTGTSFATPFVTGSAALLMEWGIVQGNDIFLYGEKVKAYLRKSAERLPGYSEYPNEIIGYGRLCLEESMPI